MYCIAPGYLTEAVTEVPIRLLDNLADQKDVFQQTCSNYDKYRAKHKGDCKMATSTRPKLVLYVMILKYNTLF